MTLARTALRLCAVAALKGSPAPTIAGARIYDSRISDLSPDVIAADAMPTAILMTDGDEGDALSTQNGGPPFHRMIDLVVELGMTQSIKDGDDYVVGYPDTDARLEGSLDLLEFQIVRRLAYDQAPLCALFRRFVRIRKRDCHRQVLDDTGVKIACRILTLTCEVNDDRVTLYNVGTAASPLVQPIGLDILPEPLRAVAKALPAGSAGLDVCTALASTLTNLTVPALAGVDADFDADGAGHAPNVTAAIDLSHS